MTRIVKRKKPPSKQARRQQTSAGQAARVKELPPVYGRSAEGLRIDFLEAVAYAIYCLESCDRAELTEFNKKLREVREREWGERPWSGAKDPERFLKHVTAMAEDFTSRPVRYRNRNRQPNPAV